MAVFNLGPIGRKFDISKGDILIRTKSLSENGTWSSITSGSNNYYKLDIKANGNWDLMIKKSCILRFKIKTNCDFFLIGGGGAGHSAIANGGNNQANDTGGYGGNGGWHNEDDLNNKNVPAYTDIPIIIGHGGGYDDDDDFYQQHGNPTIVKVEDTPWHAEGGYGNYGADTVGNTREGLAEEKNPYHTLTSSWYHWNPLKTIDGTPLSVERVGFTRGNTGLGGIGQQFGSGTAGKDGFYPFGDSTYPRCGGGGGGGAAYTSGFVWGFTASDGGKDGGGKGGSTKLTSPNAGSYKPTSGTDNYGGGGGGAGIINGSYESQTPGSGGSGVVFIRNAR